jgi:ABC-type molybdate transport system substrate-binding protein
MICALCKEVFNVSEGFEFIFSFPKICPTCQIKYQPSLKQVVIPIENGEITYFYLYEQNLLNLEQRNYLDRHLKLIYESVIKSEDKTKTVIFLDFQVLSQAKYWLKYLLPMKKIVFFSLEYLDLSYQNIFY